MLGIVCQICGKRPATSHLTEIDPSDGDRRELHLCATCIEQLDLKLESGPPPIGEILKKKPKHKPSAGDGDDEEEQLAQAEEEAEAEDSTAADEECPGCGLTFAEFAVNNRFGCARCYAAFGEKAAILLTRYHGHGVHVGRVPAATLRAPDDLMVRRAQLDAALKEAVASEAYEKAAHIRDEIKRLDQQLDS